MKKTFFILLMFSALNLNAQDDYLPGINDTVKVETRKGVKEYYTLVQKAENKIIEGNYIKASKLYTKAFKHKFPFYNDIRNALIAEYKQGFNYKRSLNYIVFMRKISEKTTDKFVADLKNIFEKDSTNEIFKDLNKILDTVKVSLNLELVAKFKELIARDQDMRGKAYKEYPQKPYESPYVDTIRQQDSINMLELIALYKKYKELPECLIGTKGKHTIGIVVLHSSAWNNLDWFPYLKKEVFKGNFDNEIYSRRVDYLVEHISLKDSIKSEFNTYNAEGGIGFFNKFLVSYFSKDISEKMNLKRAEIFLEPYENIEKKKIWRWKTIGFLAKESEFNIGIYNTFGLPQNEVENKIEAKSAYDFQEMVIKNIIKKSKEKGTIIKVYKQESKYDFTKD